MSDYWGGFCDCIRRERQPPTPRPFLELIFEQGDVIYVSRSWWEICERLCESGSGGFRATGSIAASCCCSRRFVWVGQKLFQIRLYLYIHSTYILTYILLHIYLHTYPTCLPTYLPTYILLLLLWLLLVGRHGGYVGCSAALLKRIIYVNNSLRGY